MGKTEASEGKIPPHIVSIVDATPTDCSRVLHVWMDALPDVLDAHDEPKVNLLLFNVERAIGEENLSVLLEWIGIHRGSDGAILWEEMEKDKVGIGARILFYTDALRDFFARDIPYFRDQLGNTAAAGIALDTRSESGAIVRSGGGSDVVALLRGDYAGKEPVLRVGDFPESKDGDVVLEGITHFASFGARPFLTCDSDYVLTDDGREFFDHRIFRGFARKRVRVLREGDGFSVEEAK